MSILIQAIKKHIPAIGSLLIEVKGRVPDAIPTMPERSIIRLEQLDWLPSLFGILRRMIGIRPPQATLSSYCVKVRTACCNHLIVTVHMDNGSIKCPLRQKERALLPSSLCAYPIACRFDCAAQYNMRHAPNCTFQHWGISYVKLCITSAILLKVSRSILL